MKKLLLGSMLVLGATSFGAGSVLEGIEDTKIGKNPATLNIQVTGSVVDDTKYTLIVRALDGGNSTNTMQFNFDGLTKNQEIEKVGRYSAGVYKENKLITEEYKIESHLKRGETEVTGVTTIDNKAELKYSLVEPHFTGGEYRGAVNVSAKGLEKGNFVDNGVNLEVFVKNK